MGSKRWLIGRAASHNHLDTGRGAALEATSDLFSAQELDSFLLPRIFVPGGWRKADQAASLRSSILLEISPAIPQSQAMIGGL
jgi:hypothetical protein